ncbi:hypothetical protein GCM10025868_17440 [Angustibacter aerolatus]|uniref:Uncharacterized protein n=1 Tax=Angustibacter aerolatus TaxID=1162965 RepID=A0ABQ6JH91_9ACTN|nr:hypothetical protein GCM10025868_17440 [Angustibacter aerolatus]
MPRPVTSAAGTPNRRSAPTSHPTTRPTGSTATTPSYVECTSRRRRWAACCAPSVSACTSSTGSAPGVRTIDSESLRRHAGAVAVQVLLLVQHHALVPVEHVAQAR